MRRNKPLDPVLYKEEAALIRENRIKANAAPKKKKRKYVKRCPKCGQELPTLLDQLSNQKVDR